MSEASNHRESGGRATDDIVERSSQPVSILLPHEMQVAARYSSTEMMQLLHGLDTNSETMEGIEIKTLLEPVLAAPDGSIAKTVITNAGYGWANSSGDIEDEEVITAAAAIRFKDDLVKEIRLSNESRRVRRPSFTEVQYQRGSPRGVDIAEVARKISGADTAPNDDRSNAIIFENSSETEKKRKNSIRKAATITIPGQSRPGAPPSNQLNTLATSLFIFSGDVGTCSGGVRFRVFRIMDSTFFERTVLAVIMANSITLAIDIPSTKNNDNIQDFLTVSEYAFLVLFTIEMTLKVVSLGFVLHPHSYLRNSWNVMDFTVVMIGYFSLLAPSGDDNYSVLRLLRIIRPLRVVNRVPQMKSIMNALVHSLPGMRDVFLLLAFFLVVFAIVGVRLFDGQLHKKCYYPISVSQDSWNESDIPFNESTSITIEPDRRECDLKVGLCLVANDGSFPCSTSTFSGRQCSPFQSQNGTSIQTVCSIVTSISKDPVLNFDTFYSACLLVFKVISLDDWPDDMNRLQSTMGWGVWIYFLLITLFGAFFCINLFLAVLSLEYYRAKVEAEREDDNLQAEDDQEGNWEIAELEVEPDQEKATRGSLFVPAGGQRRGSVRSVRLLDPVRRRSSHPETEIVNSAESSIAEIKVSGFFHLRQRVKAFVKHAWFSHFMLAVTCCNVFVMALDHHNAPKGLDDFIAWANFVCSIIFIAEMIVKWFGLGPTNYFTEEYKDTIPAAITIPGSTHSKTEERKMMATITRRKINGYNTFDCVLVIISIPELVMRNSEGNFNAFRIFRLARILRLLRRNPTLRKLLLTIVASVVAVAYLFLLMLLFIFMYGILGLQLFDTAYPEDSRENFNSLWESFLTVFIVITGESWATIMKEAMIGTSAAAFLYFVPLFIFGNYMLINLFIAILIDEFMRCKEDEESDEFEEPISLKSDQEESAMQFLRRVSAKLSESGNEVEEQPEYTFGAPGGDSGIESPRLVLQQSAGHSATDSEYIENDPPPASESPQRAKPPPRTPSRAVTKIKTLPTRKEVSVNACFNLMSDHFFGEWREIREMTPEQQADNWDLHGVSLNIFPRTHPFRLTVASIVMHPLFTGSVLSVILANVVFLAVDSPSASERMRDFLDIGDICFTILFTLELMLRVIVMGFYGPKNPDGVPKAYLTHISEKTALSVGSGPSSLRVWNRLDFFVVVTAFAGIGVKELKLCRSLRTIRLVVHSEGIRVVIMSLFRALTGLANVTVVCLFLWLSFGILAVQLFKGQFYYCTDGSVDTRWDCIGTWQEPMKDVYGTIYITSQREWKKLRYNFDHLGVAMLTLFEIAVGEGWATIMFSGIDARGVDKNPKRNARPFNAIFFVLFVVVGQFFAMNLFVGMLIEVFTSSKATEEGSILMTEPQRKWVRANKLLSYAKLSPMPLVPRVVKYGGKIVTPGLGVTSVSLKLRANVVGEWIVDGKKEQVSVTKGRYRCTGETVMKMVGCSAVLEGSFVEDDVLSGTAFYAFEEGTFELRVIPHSIIESTVQNIRSICFIVTMSSIFGHLITTLIVVNVFVMMLKHYNQSDFYVYLLEVGNWFFVGCFTIEAMIKQLGLGYQNYFRDDWNKFDFFLVVVSWVERVNQGSSGIGILRVLRIGRVFRLIKRAKNLQKLFGTLIQALPSLGNVSLLLVVTFFIFGVVGVELFGKVTLSGNDGLNEYANFQNVPYALITLYQYVVNWCFFSNCIHQKYRE